MHKVIEGLYENGAITLKRKPDISKAKIQVIFLEDISSPKLFQKIPDIFLRPLKVKQFRRFSREELHER